MQIKAQTTVAVFGGSFSPFHKGHLGIVRALAEDAEIDRVLVVPARRSPFKDGTPQLPDDVRWNMLQRGLAGAEGRGGGWDVHLCDMEMRRPPPSYTFETLEILSSLYPGCRLELALGWDAFLEFARWQRSAEILRLAGLILFDRAGVHPTGIGERGGESEGRSDKNNEGNSKALLDLLPPPWGDGAAGLAELDQNGRGRITGRDGRVLLRRAYFAPPKISGREILQSRSLEGVPPGAREVLEAYWRQG